MTIIVTATIIAIIAVIAIAAILRTDRMATTPAPVEDAAPVESDTLFLGAVPLEASMAMQWARESADRGDIRQAEIYRELAVRLGYERSGYNFWGERI